jgi:hypothetical protein
MNYQIWLWARAVERIIVVAFGGISLILGWNLFKSGILRQQQAEFSKAGFSIKMLNVGPGVFFALFGAAILVTALSKPVQFAAPPPSLPDNDAIGVNRSSYYGGQSPKRLDRQDFQDLNTLRIFVNGGALRDEEKKAVADSFKRLLDLERAAAFTAYPSMKDRFDSISQRFSVNPSSLSSLPPKDQQDFRSVQSLLQDTSMTGASQ